MARVNYKIDKIPDQPIDAASTTANDAATRNASLQRADNQQEAKTFGADYGQIFSPIEINKSPTDTPNKYPTFKKITKNEAEKGGYATRNSQEGGVVPYSEDLDPYFFTHANDNVNDNTPIIQGKTDISTVHNDGDGDDLNPRKNNTIEEVRTVGLKGPILLSSWGYDIGGKPVPARSREGDDSFKFRGSFAGQRSSWKTGPVHLLWDEERQVWSGGLPMLMGVATSDIDAPKDPRTPTTFTMEVLRKNDSDDETSFHPVPGQPEEVELENYDPSIDQKLVLANRDPDGEHDWETNPSLVWILAVKMNYKWIPFYVGCPPECVTSEHCAKLYEGDPSDWECEGGECVATGNEEEGGETDPGGGTEV